MDPKKVLTADYLDIIYDHRNKKYGGYELRKHYDRRVRKATVFALTGVAALLSLSFITSNRAKELHTQTVMHENTISDLKIPIQPIEKPKVIPPSPPPAQHLKTIPFTEPLIEPDIKVTPDKQMTENKNLSNVQPGITTHDGDSTGIDPLPHKGTGTGVVMTDNSKSNDPVRWVQQMPQFMGDMNDYLGRNLHYPEAARSAGIEGRVAVEFVVNEDGSVSNAKVVRSIGGGCDDEALRIVRNMPKWKPGKQNGTAVKVLFVLPILFQLN